MLGVNFQQEPVSGERAAVVNPRGTKVDLGHASPSFLKVDRETVRAYLTEMYLDVPGLLQIWTYPHKRSGQFFETTVEGIEQAITSIERAGNVGGQQSIYARITTMKGRPETEHSRGSAVDSKSFIGLWTDVDFGTTGHASKEVLPPNAEYAQMVYDATGLPEASITVNSGGGLYHIVKLAEPLDVTDDETRMRINALSRRWQQKVKSAAKDMGFAYGTGVSDLARVLRIPGTINAKDWKNKRPATYQTSGLRYTLDELEAACPAPPKPARNAVRLTGEPAKDARARFEHHLAEMRATTFERNNALNEKAFMCFQYAGAGQLDPDEVEREFIAAGLDSGLEQGETEATVNSAKAGLQKPYVWRDFTRTDRVDVWAGEQVTETPPAEAPVITAPEPPAVKPELPEQPPAPPVPPSPPADEDDVPEPAGVPPVDITNERDGLQSLIDVINQGVLPETYVRDGRLVHVGVVSGARNGRRRKAQAAAERTAPDMTASQLRALLGRYTYTFAYNAKMQRVPKLPAEALCKAVLAVTEWPDVPDLVEITTMPFVREDGTVCQKRGYDEATGTWLNVDEGFPEVPEKPTEEQVEAAKELLLGKLLRDFPFVGPADRSNYTGLLATPALKYVTGTLTPLGVITAASAGSGKSLLAEIISRVYGSNGTSCTMPRQDEELRKLITSKLMSDPHAVVTFDNIGKGHRIESGTLSSMLTETVWTDRILGGNDIVSRINDKLWLATGNNVQFGGEMGSRSVLVRIDPKMERPDQRDTDRFVLGNLQTWMAIDANRLQVMHALLVLIRAWASAGMPEGTVNMRTFSPWSRKIGGFLDFHGLEGFLTNQQEAEEADEESYEWAQFLSAWHNRHPGEWMTTAQLTASYRSTQFEVMNGMHDPWAGAFPLRENGQPYSNQGLGMKLKYIIDRPFHGWVLRKQLNKSTKQQMWRSERMEEGGSPPPPEKPGQMQFPTPEPQRRPASPPGQHLDQVRSGVNSILRTMRRPINITYDTTQERRQ